MTTQQTRLTLTNNLGKTDDFQHLCTIYLQLDQCFVQLFIVFFSRYIYPKYLRKACCKINNYSSLITLGDVWSVMSKTEEAQFRETAIGYPMDMPAKQKWSAAVFCFLMSRRINVEPERRTDDEIWFNIQESNRELCFRKEDFALISGLNFRQLSDRDFIVPAGKSKLMEKHFPRKKKTKGMDLYDFLIFKTVACNRDDKKYPGSDKMNRRRKIYINKEPVPCEAADRVKVALIYVVHMFLLGKQDIHYIDADLWHLVENLSDFNNYPWGERVYKSTFCKSVSAFDFQIKKIAKNEQQEHPRGVVVQSVKPQGMPQVLVVWFLALFPGVLETWGETVSNGLFWRPLMLKVLCLKTINHNQLVETVKRSDLEMKITTQDAQKDRLQEMIEKILKGMVSLQKGTVSDFQIVVTLEFLVLFHYFASDLS
ncbi:hypothetical protein MKW94_019488 [Papaver nudicaule]|uniref:DUF1985 domain-containing protein n=1 Tax=Papaver nudicaule TaxID=74823 RepID=A0AA41VPH4_PAPNU|nr:hypothetical protein [Papaver nudicaule]